jgi:hypothetical protein
LDTSISPDGKSNSSVRVISLDAFTVELLRQYLEVLDGERAAFGSGYDTSHSKLMRFEDGRRLHADTVTLRCNRLVDLGLCCPSAGTSGSTDAAADLVDLDLRVGGAHAGDGQATGLCQRLKLVRPWGELTGVGQKQAHPRL